jgi:sulfite reductase (ferredoxin)
MPRESPQPASHGPVAPIAQVPQPTSVETLKESSDYLRGKILAELADGSDHVSKDSYNLLKFHGTYQQEDRDARKQRDRTGVHKHYMFMVRCKIPGGKLTAEQYLALDDLASLYANGTVRLTTRQGIQFHGVVKKDLQGTIRGINDTLLTTLGACGDVERNVMACPAPIHDALHQEIQAACDSIAEHLAPRTTAYHEVWLNGELLRNREEAATRAARQDTEPLYGKTYLPRKFKTGITLPHDNCIDVFAQDLGFVADVDADRIVGWNVLVGGGMGMSNSNPETFPFLAQPMCWVPRDRLLHAAEAVVKLYRDHGNRADRKRARIKYLVHDWGVPRFREVLSSYLTEPLILPKPIPIAEGHLHLGWEAQGNGLYWYGLSVENGRIKDDREFRLRSALWRIVARWRPQLRITPNQDLLLCDLPEQAEADVKAILREHGVKRPDQLTPLQMLSMACPAIPTCGLALSESERVLPGLIDQLEAELARLGLQEERISVRMTGCPNGCARPYQSEIGIVGRSGDKYTIYVGGAAAGDRLNFVFRDLTPIGEIVPLLARLFGQFQRERLPGERLGDFCHRVGLSQLPGAAG